MRYRRRRVDMIEVYKFITGVYSTDANVLFDKTLGLVDQTEYENLFHHFRIQNNKLLNHF